MPALTPYVRRGHDAELEELAKAAARGESRVAVVYGESSTGKTRACWEMLAPLRTASPAWRLWDPIDLDGLIAGLPLVGPRTVIWLNEAKEYLDTADEAGEKAAAALRKLTRDPSRGPVLVIATLWHGDWVTLTKAPRPPYTADRHRQARELLAGRGHRVPAEFSPADPSELKRLSAADPRLAEAVDRAPGRRVIQYLAGAPLLKSRYDSLSMPAKALVYAAMDARRMGHGKALPLELLAGAADGYVPGDDPDLQSDGDWLSTAIDSASEPVARGIEGPLTKVRTRARHRRGQRLGHEELASPGECYYLADYLDQQGRLERHDIIPPATFWDAAMNTTASDMAALAYSARRRGLTRTAATLGKQAAPQSAWAAAELVETMSHVCPDDQEPALWSAQHAPVTQTDGVTHLINVVRDRAGAQFLAPLLARQPGARASLQDPHAIADLIYALEQVEASEQAEVLADRAARDATLSRPSAVADLLGHLQEQGKTLQAAAVPAEILAERAAREVPLDNPWEVATLLDALSGMSTGKLVPYPAPARPCAPRVACGPCLGRAPARRAAQSRRV